VTVTVADWAMEFAETKTQQACIAALNKSGAAVAAAQGKESVTTIKEATQGLVVDAAARLIADPKNKVQTARTKTTAADAAKCTLAPDFAYAGAVAVNDAAQEQRLAFVADLFGPDLNAAIITRAVNDAGAKCQLSVTQASEKLAATSLKQFVVCKKNGMNRGEIVSRVGVEGCYAQVLADPTGKIGKARVNLAAAVSKSCSGLDLATVFPGACAGSADFGTCVADRLRARLCQTLEGADALSLNCGS
jgi:hypothetical protein